MNRFINITIFLLLLVQISYSQSIGISEIKTFENGDANVFQDRLYYNGPFLIPSNTLPFSIEANGINEFTTHGNSVYIGGGENENIFWEFQTEIIIDAIGTFPSDTIYVDLDYRFSNVSVADTLNAEWFNFGNNNITISESRRDDQIDLALKTRFVGEDNSGFFVQIRYTLFSNDVVISSNAFTSQVVYFSNVNATPTSTNTPTPTFTPTVTNTPTPTNTPENPLGTFTPTPTATNTPIPDTPTNTPTPTSTNTPTNTFSPTPTVTSTPTNTPESVAGGVDLAITRMDIDHNYFVQGATLNYESIYTNLGDATYSDTGTWQVNLLEYPSRNLISVLYITSISSPLVSGASVTRIATVDTSTLSGTYILSATIDQPVGDLNTNNGVLDSEQFLVVTPTPTPTVTNTPTITPTPTNTPAVTSTPTPIPTIDNEYRYDSAKIEDPFLHYMNVLSPQWPLPSIVTEGGMINLKEGNVNKLYWGLDEDEWVEIITESNIQNIIDNSEISDDDTIKFKEFINLNTTQYGLSFHQTESIYPLFLSGHSWFQFNDDPNRYTPMLSARGGMDIKVDHDDGDAGIYPFRVLEGPDEILSVQESGATLNTNLDINSGSVDVGASISSTDINSFLEFSDSLTSANPVTIGAIWDNFVVYVNNDQRLTVNDIGESIDVAGSDPKINIYNNDSSGITNITNFRNYLKNSNGSSLTFLDIETLSLNATLGSETSQVDFDTYDTGTLDTSIRIVGHDAEIPNGNLTLSNKAILEYATNPGTFEIYQGTTYANIISNKDIRLDPTNFGTSGGKIYAATKIIWPSEEATKLEFFSGGTYSIGVSTFDLDFTSDLNHKFHSDTVQDLMIIEGDVGNVISKNNITSGNDFFAGGVYDFTSDTVGDKIKLFGELYKIGVAANEVEFYSDRDFTWSSDVTTDALVLDAETGQLTGNGINQTTIVDGGTDLPTQNAVYDFVTGQSYLTTVDISNDTNLAAGTGITLTDDTVSVTSYADLFNISTDDLQDIGDGSMSANQIAYSNGTSLVGSSNFVYDGGNLTIKNDGVFPGAIANTHFALTGETNSNKRLGLGFDTTNDYGWMQAAEYTVAFRNLVLNPSGGNVGIGETSPDRTLHVNSGSDLYPVKWERNTSQPGYLYSDPSGSGITFNGTSGFGSGDPSIYASGNTFNIYAGSTNDFNVHTDGSLSFQIDDSLDYFNFYGSNPALQTKNTNSTSTGNYTIFDHVLKNSVGTDTVYTRFFTRSTGNTSGSETTEFEINTRDTGSYTTALEILGHDVEIPNGDLDLNANALLNADLGTYAGTGLSWNGTQFTATGEDTSIDVANTEIAFGDGTGIVGSSAFTWDGFLHIDTTNPVIRLSDNNSTNNTDSTGRLEFYDNTGLVGWVGYTSTGDGNMEIKNTANADLEFWTNNTRRATIDSSGNVGIGETSPVRTLHVNSTAADIAKLETTSTEARLEFVDSNTVNTVKIGSVGDDFRVYTGGANRIYIDDSADFFNFYGSDLWLRFFNTDAASNANNIFLDWRMNSSTTERTFFALDVKSIDSVDASRTTQVDIFSMDNGSYNYAMQFVGHDVEIPNGDLTVSGGQGYFDNNIRVNGSDGIEVRRGMHGGYGGSSPASTNWGANIWSIGDSWSGTGYGSSYVVSGVSSQYGLTWLRSAHPRVDAFSSEGLYLYRAGTNYASFGYLGSTINTRLEVNGNITGDGIRSSGSITNGGLLIPDENVIYDWAHLNFANTLSDLTPGTADGDINMGGYPINGIPSVHSSSSNFSIYDSGGNQNMVLTNAEMKMGTNVNLDMTGNDVDDAGVVEVDVIKFVPNTASTESDLANAIPTNGMVLWKPDGGSIAYLATEYEEGLIRRQQLISYADRDANDTYHFGIDDGAGNIYLVETHEP